MGNKKVMIGTWAWGAGMNGTKMVFGYKQDPEALISTFNKAYEFGFRDWDTAAVYGMGSCEEFLRPLIADKDIFISTKFMPGRRYKLGELTKSFEASMGRLGIKEADLFWIHRPLNLDQNVREAIPLLQSGKIKSLGISNVSLDDIHTAEAILKEKGLKLGAVQNHFSLLRNDQQPIIDYCNSNGITYYAYMVLEQGALTGRFSTANPFPAFSFRSFLFPKSNFKKIEGLLELTSQIASKYGIDQSQVPILWAIGKGAVPIVGLTKTSHAEKLYKAVDVTLAPEELLKLDEAAAATGICQKGSWE